VAPDALALLARYGEMPLPPYIHQPLQRPDRYQTVYARSPGSSAAPTAGLHITEDLLAALAASDIRVAPVELVVGLDTFAPVVDDDPLQHRIHSERYRIPESTWEIVGAAGRVVAVGTTSVRALETAAATGQLEGRSSLFLHGGHSVELVDVLMTNFHLPRTTLLMLVEAVIGPRWRRLYEVAAASGYRFLSFGDAMLLDRHAR
jgi:S-adenosylmethionine:tRNA ribosyltransferase-isomerase